MTMPRNPLPLPELDILNETFRIERDGRIVNRISRTSRKKGSYADAHFRAGYRTVYVAGKLRFAHRIIWKMIHGFDPNFIDHIDGNILNNRPSNLREATNSQNKMNSGPYKNNTSGTKGVHRRSDSGLWRAYISHNGKRVWLGQFLLLDAAIAAVETARTNFHGQYRKL